MKISDFLSLDQTARATLDTLSLERQYFHALFDATYAELLLALEQCVNLRELSVAHCCLNFLPTQRLEDFAATLKKCKKLRSLDISFNQSLYHNDNNIDALFDELAACKNLQVLRMSDSSLHTLSPFHWGCVCMALLSIKGLQVLDISHNQLVFSGADKWQQFCYVLSNLKNLRVLKLNDDADYPPQGPQIQPVLTDALSQMRNLRHIEFSVVEAQLIRKVVQPSLIVSMPARMFHNSEIYDTVLHNRRMLFRYYQTMADALMLIVGNNDVANKVLDFCDLAKVDAGNIKLLCDKPLSNSSQSISNEPYQQARTFLFGADAPSSAGKRLRMV